MEKKTVGRRPHYAGEIKKKNATIIGHFVIAIEKNSGRDITRLT